MQFDALHRIAAEAIGDQASHPTREPGWLYYHGFRTARLSLWLRGALGAAVEPLVLYAGALFHDLGKDQEPHPETGARRAEQLLAGCCSPAELEQVCQIIRLHNQRGAPGHPPAVRIVQDADILDHVGPLGPWLAFYWSGSKGESFDQHRRYLLGVECARDRADMRSRLNFPLSIQVFDRRIAFEDQFFATFHDVYQNGTWEEDQE